MHTEDLKALILEASSTVYTDTLLRIIFLFSSGVAPTDPDQKDIVDDIEDIICYLNIRSQIED